MGEYAVGVISHLSVHSDSGRKLVQAGGVEALLLFLREHNMDLQVICKSLLASRKTRWRCCIRLRVLVISKALKASNYWWTPWRRTIMMKRLSKRLRCCFSVLL